VRSKDVMVFVSYFNVCLLLADNSSSAGGSIGNKAAIALGKRLGLKLATPDLSSGELSKMFGDADLFAMVRIISIREFGYG
jgi:hypothetical protein